MPDKTLTRRKGRERAGKPKADPRVAAIFGRVSPRERADFWHACQRFGFRSISEGVCELALAFHDSALVREAIRGHWRKESAA